MLFISQALAEETAKQSNMFMSFLPMIAFVGILYFLLIRPQQKKSKQHQALVSSIKKGDKVITNSGIIATVSKIINDQEIMLEISDGVHCKFLRSAIANMFEKTAEESPKPIEKKETVHGDKKLKAVNKPIEKKKK
jgi:preprotein translocase subunit YajC